MKKSLFLFGLLSLSWVFFSSISQRDNLITSNEEVENPAIPKIVINPLGHSGKINQLLYSPDGTRIITVSNDKSIRVWDAQKGEELSAIHIEQGEGYEGMIYAADLSPDGKLLAVAGYPVIDDVVRNYVTVIDLEKNEQKTVGIGHTDIINAVKFSPDGSLIATGSNDQTVRIWKLGDKEEMLEIGNLSVGAIINDLSFSKMGNKLAVASTQNNGLWLFDMSMAKAGYVKSDFDQWKGHKGGVREVEFSPDGNYVASAGNDNRIILWSPDGLMLKEIDELIYPVNSLTFSLDDQILVAMTDVEGKGRSYSLPSGNQFTEFKGHDNTVLTAAFSPESKNGNYLIASAGGSNNEIIVWNAISGKELSDLKGKGSIVWHARFGEGYKVYLSKIPLEEKSNQTYAITFDFANQVVGETVTDKIDFNSNQDPQQRYNVLDDYRLLDTRGKIIENDPSYDGRILCYLPTPDGGVIIGSDLSLKYYNSEGLILKELVAHTGGIRDLTISSDGRYIVSASEDQTVNLWDLQAEGYMISVADYFSDQPEFMEFLDGEGLQESYQKRSYQGWEEVISYLQGEGYRVVRDVAEIYEQLAEKISPKASLFIADDLEYVCWTPEGYFSCSSKGAEYFGWHINNGIKKLADFYTAEQYFDILYQPDLVAKTITDFKTARSILEAQGEKPFDLTKLQKPSAGFFGKPLPAPGEPALTYKNRIFSTNAKKVTLTVDAFDGGGGINEVNIYQNGKLIISDTEHRSINKDSVHIRYEVDLLNGPNLFKLVIKNIQGIESRPDNIEILYNGDVIATSDMYLFVVGINEYKNPRYNLNYARPDAESIVEKVIDRNKKLFHKIETIEIYDENGTKENILNAFEQVKQKAKIHDVFVFYYAGHGSMMDPEDNNSEYFLVPTDVTQIYGNAELLMERGISSSELNDQFLEINAQKQLILLDACHSGAALNSFRSRSASAEEKAIFQLARSAGVVVISASQADQFATEFDQLGHGVFTYSLLEGLDGKADGSKDNKVTVSELKIYMDERIPDLSSEYGGEAQYPTGFITGQDFPIGLVSEVESATDLDKGDEE